MSAAGATRAQGADRNEVRRHAGGGVHGPLTAIDIPNLLNQTGDKLEASSRDGDVLVFRIRKK